MVHSTRGRVGPAALGREVVAVVVDRVGVVDADEAGECLEARRVGLFDHRVAAGEGVAGEDVRGVDLAFVRLGARHGRDRLDGLRRGGVVEAVADAEGEDVGAVVALDDFPAVIAGGGAAPKVGRRLQPARVRPAVVTATRERARIQGARVSVVTGGSFRSVSGW